MPRACKLYVLMLCIVAIATSMLALKGKELSITKLKERMSPDFPATFTEYQPKITNSRTASNLNLEYHRSTPLHSSPLSFGVDP